MLPTCREVAEQLSEEIDQPITGFKKFKLKLHLLMCVHCRRYKEQLELSSKTVDLLAAKNQPNAELRETLLAHFRESCQPADSDPDLDLDPDSHSGPHSDKSSQS